MVCVQKARHKCTALLQSYADANKTVLQHGLQVKQPRTSVLFEAATLRRLLHSPNAVIPDSVLGDW